MTGFAQSLHLTVAFWQVLHNLCIRRSRFGTFSSLCILPPHTCSPFSHMIAFLLLSLTLSIERSHFGRFCTISAFKGRVLAAFTLRILTPHTCPPFLHTIAFMQLSLTLSFQRRILACFAQSLHSTFACSQVLHNLCIQRSRFGSFSSLRILTPCTYLPFSHTITFLQLWLTLSIQRSHFARFCTISAFDGRVLAGLAQSLHLTVTFWQLFLSPHSHTPHLPPVLPYDRIFAAFAYSQHSTVAFWQVLHNLCIRRSRLGRFGTISTFDGCVLAAFPLSTFSHSAPTPRSRI